jgi:hypothetical protein
MSRQKARGRKQCQMTNVRGGDHGFITIANQSTGLRDEDHVGVQRGVAGSLPAHLPGRRPKLRRLQHDRRGDRRISEHALQRFQAAKPSVLAGPKQLAANFVIRDLRNHDFDTVISKTSEPVLARLIFRGAFRIRDHSQRTSVQQNDQAHDKSL